MTDRISPDFVLLPPGSAGGHRLRRRVTLGIRHISLGDDLIRELGFPARMDVFYSEKAKALAFRVGEGASSRVVFKVKGGSSYQININHPFKTVRRAMAVRRGKTVYLKGIEYNDLMQESLR